MSDAASQRSNGFRFLIHELTEVESNVVALNSALFEAVQGLMVQMGIVQKSLRKEKSLREPKFHHRMRHPPLRTVDTREPNRQQLVRERSSLTLEGMQPTFRQVPPRVSRFSTQAVFRPSWAALTAAT